MNSSKILALLLTSLLLTGCLGGNDTSNTPPPQQEDKTGSTGNTGNTGNTGDTGSTENTDGTGNTNNNENTESTGDTGNTGVSTEPTGSRIIGAEGVLRELEGLAFPDGIQTSSHYNLTILDAKKQDDKILVYANREYSILNLPYKERLVFRLSPDAKTLDTTFAENGLLKIGGAESNSALGSSHAHTRDSQGRILLLNNNSSSAATGVYSLQRYSADGQLDTSFASNPNSTPWGSQAASHQPSALLVLNNNSLIWGGVTGGQFASDGFQWSLGRITAEGAFSGDPVKLNLPAKMTKNHTQILKILADETSNHLYLLGRADDQYLLARLFLNTFQLDANFGTNGFAEIAEAGIATNGWRYSLQDFLLDEQGRIIVVGTGPGASSNINNAKAEQAFHIYRFTLSGLKDTVFGEQGLIKVDFGNTGRRTSIYQDRATHVQLTTSGKILVSGTTSGTDGPWLNMVRLMHDGSIDTSFDFHSKRLETQTQSLRTFIRDIDSAQTAVIQSSEGQLIGISANPDSSNSRQSTSHPIMIQWWN